MKLKLLTIMVAARCVRYISRNASRLMFYRDTLGKDIARDVGIREYLDEDSEWIIKHLGNDEAQKLFERFRG